MSDNVIRPVEFYILENEKLKQELEETRKVMLMSTRLNLQMIEEIMNQVKENKSGN